jgi:hypothetical protein
MNLYFIIIMANTWSQSIIKYLVLPVRIKFKLSWLIKRLGILLQWIIELITCPGPTIVYKINWFAAVLLYHGVGSGRLLGLCLIRADFGFEVETGGFSVVLPRLGYWTVTCLQPILFHLWVILIFPGHLFI